MFVRQRLWVTVYLAPCLAFIMLFIFFPVLQSIYYSFLHWDLTGVKKWIGIGNYIQLSADKVFHTALYNTFIFIISSIVFQLGTALLLAVLVYHKIRGALIFRTVFFVPVVVSSVSVALMFSMIYDPGYGLLNSLLKSVGLSTWTRQWLADPDTAFYYAMLPKIWQFIGLYVVILYTGLTEISAEVYEAADIDGAGPISKLLHVTLPMLKEVLTMSVILISINTWKSFEEIWVLTGGGPSHSTEIVGTYMVNKTFTTFQYGYGSSISTVILIFGVFLTVGLRYLSSLINRD